MFADGPVYTVYVGECEEHKPKFSDYCDILETLKEQALDEDFGEGVDGWFSLVPKEWTKELNEAVDNAILTWLEKHDLKPKFFKVCSWVEVEVTLK